MKFLQQSLFHRCYWMIMNYLDVKEWFVKELKLNDQIWIDYKANNEVSSGEALKRIKLFEYSNLYLCLFFHYIIQGSLCSQRDHEKVMLKTQVSRITLLVSVQWDWGRGLWPPNMHLHVTMSHNATLVKRGLILNEHLPWTTCWLFPKV